MSEELTKEMENVTELEEAHASTAKVNKIDHGETEQKSPKHDKSVKKSPDNTTSKSGASKKQTEATEKEDEDVEEKEQKEAVTMPKLKSEIMQGIVDHMKGLKKEDLAKMYGSVVMTEDDDEEEYEDPEDTDGDGEKDDEGSGDEAESTKVKKESIDQVIDKLDVSQDVEALIGGEEEVARIQRVASANKKAEAFEMFLSKL